MEKRIQGIIFVLILIFYPIIRGIFEGFLSKSMNYTLWGIWGLLVILFFIWLRKTAFYKKSPSERIRDLEGLGFYSVTVPLLYILGIISFGMGLAILIFADKDNVNGFIGMSIVGAFVVLVAFITNRFRKNSS